jgi:transposase
MVIVYVLQHNEPVPVEPWCPTKKCKRCGTVHDQLKRCPRCRL